MKTRVVLHIGHSKTGTSTIQSAMSANRSELLSHAILYPKTGWQGGAHHPIANCFMPPHRQNSWIARADPKRLRVQLDREIDAALPLCVLLSSEVFYLSRAPLIRDWLRADDATAVVMLRRQDLWADSLYQQQLKAGETDLPFDEWLTPRAGGMDYAKTLRQWASVFGRGAIRVGVFEPKRMPQGLLRYFLDVAEIGHAPDLPEPPAQNERLSRAALEYLRRCATEGLSGEQRASLRSALESYTQKHPDPPEWRSFLSPQRRREILASCAEGNAEIVRFYLNGQNLFEELQEDGPFAPYPGLDAATEARIRDYVEAHRSAAATASAA